jgi:hypothetical protein
MPLEDFIITVFGQLTERFHIQKVWARDLWRFYKSHQQKSACPHNRNFCE